MKLEKHDQAYPRNILRKFNDKKPKLKDTNPCPNLI